MSMALEDIAAERARQVSAEGWTPEHDDEHSDFQMARAAGVYALGVWHVHLALAPFWPWELRWWKVKSPRRDLIRAGALIVAEIERLDRQSQTEHDPKQEASE